MIEAIYMVGAGGHAKAVMAALSANHIVPVAIYDDSPHRQGTALYGVPIQGGIDDFAALGAVSAVIAIGDNNTRKHIAERFPAVDWLTVVHPYTCIHASVQIGKGSVILEGAIVQPDVVIGQHCILNVESMIGHDCVLENYVHVSGAKLTGNVHLREGVLLGANTTVHPGVTIGQWSKSAICSAVMRDVAPYSVLIGNPARCISSTAPSPETGTIKTDTPLNLLD
jgi:sugar O-acyltransferase (sialic acid O-acetyltransferase NeuD family)